jgi:hypothetical protein
LQSKAFYELSSEAAGAKYLHFLATSVARKCRSARSKDLADPALAEKQNFLGSFMKF